MNCDCINEYEKKMAEHFAEQAGEGCEAKLQNTAWILNPKSVRTMMNMVFRIKGSNKGFTSQRGKEVTLVCAYCPFCGKKTGSIKETE